MDEMKLGEVARIEEVAGKRRRVLKRLGRNKKSHK